MFGGSEDGDGIISDFANMGFLRKGNKIAKIDSSLRYVIFIGSIIILLNCFSNLLLYLKNKNENEKDETTLNIYKAQMAVLFIVIITMGFLIIFGGGVDWGKTDSNGIIEVLKWIFMTIIIVVLSILVNKKTGLRFFGLNIFES